jgi:hypothetical protein
MSDKPKPGSYIDTQGMSGPSDPSIKNSKQEYKPAMHQPRRLFTPEYAMEMKILINEVLDEREGKSGISYFDTEHFKHTVIEEEPPYTPYQ